MKILKDLNEKSVSVQHTHSQNFPLNSVKRVLFNESDIYFVNQNDIICVIQLYFFDSETNVWKYRIVIQWVFFLNGFLI